MCKKTKEVKKQVQPTTTTTTSNEHAEMEKNQFMEGHIVSTDTVSKEKLYQRSVPAKAKQLNTGRSFLGIKCNKPGENEVPVKKLDLPSSPLISGPFANDDVEELSIEELTGKVKETEKAHDDVTKILEKTDSVLTGTKPVIDDFEDFEEIDLTGLEEKEKKEEKKEETEAKKEILDDLEDIEEIDFGTHDEQAEKKDIVEVQTVVKQVEFETSLEEKKAKLEKDMAEARAQKKPLDKLSAQYKEVLDAMARVRHRKEAQEAIELYSHNVGKLYRTTLTPEDVMGSRSDGICRDKKANLLKLADTMAGIGNTEGVQEAVRCVQEYAKSNHYEIGHAKEARLLKRAIDSFEKVKVNDYRASGVLAELKRLVGGGLDVNLDEVPAEQKLNCVGMQPKDKMNRASLFTRLRQSVLFSSALCKWVDRKDEPLFAHEPTINDLRQGKVSNCYMVSAVTSLIQYDPNIIKNAMRQERDGSVTVRLYKKGKPIYVTVDKKTPQLVTGGAILTDGPLWMNVLERAIAFVGRAGNEGYGSLWYGDGSEIISLLTGTKPSDRIAVKASATNEKSEYDRNFDEDEQTKLFLEICSAKQLGRIYSCGTYNSSGAGLNDGHAYTLLGGCEIDGKRYVQLRNPYANMSLRYDEKGKRSKSTNYTSSVADATCGQFLMKFEEFLRDFSSINYVTVKGAPGIPDTDETN